MRRAALALTLAAALAPAAGAARRPAPPPAPGQTVHRHTAAGTAAARHVLVRLRDLGRGWRDKAPASRTASLTCSSFTPSLAGVVETGAAVSPQFLETRQGPFLAQSAWVYETPAEAAALWRRVVGDGLARCFSDSVRAGSTSQVAFAVASRVPLGLPRLGVRAAGYRVAATARSAGQTVTAYYDLIVLGAGRTVTELTFARFSEPMPRARELALARLVARRL